jgi:hypothetical protein
MKKKRVKEKADQVSRFRILLELGKTVIGGIVRAVVSHFLDHHR